MLKSSNRMTREYFAEVFANSSVRHTPHFLVRLAFKKEGLSRGTAVISKKVEKSAVSRHRLRRQIYSTLHFLFPTLEKNIDIIVIAKRGAGSITFDEIKAEIWSAVGK